MRGFDISPLLRSSIGFENLNRLVELAGRVEPGDAYPPYNIEKLGDGAYRIQMAVAGFGPEDISITQHENSLLVTGRVRQPDAQRQFLHRGIAKRAFERRFQLADTIKVTGAGFENGLLNIELVREIPEHKKPRRVEISAAVDALPVTDETRLAAQ